MIKYIDKSCYNILNPKIKIKFSIPFLFLNKKIKQRKFSFQKFKVWLCYLSIFNLAGSLSPSGSYTSSSGRSSPESKPVKRRGRPPGSTRAPLKRLGSSDEKKRLENAVNILLLLFIFLPYPTLSNIHVYSISILKSDFCKNF